MPGTSGRVGERRKGRRKAAIDDDGGSGGGGGLGVGIIIFYNDRPPLLLELTAGETMTQSKSGEVCTTPSKFSALDLAPLNVRLSLHTDG